ncbi:MAG: aminoacetone oxidase family FAD-binding enzyme [Lachnospiraceae bacterium]
MKQVVIIGAGMCGLVAAVLCARSGLKVTVLERQECAGKKLLMTGNGKCNLSNERITSKAYLTDDRNKLEIILNSYQDAEFAFWDSLGLLTKVKNGGVYPLSNQAKTVVTLLVNECKRQGVTFYFHTFCNGVNENVVITENEKNGKKQSFPYDAVILACGGMAGVYKEQAKNGYALSHQLPFSHEYCYPGLTSVKCQGDFSGIAGVRQDVSVAVSVDGRVLAEEKGELQITANGLSGIPVFQLSLWIGKALKEKQRVEFVVDFLPEFEESEWLLFMKNRYHMLLQKDEGDHFHQLRVREATLLDWLEGTVHEKFVHWVLQQYMLRPFGALSDLSMERMEKLLKNMKHMKFTALELGSFKNAQVSTGGIMLSCLDNDLQCQKQKGIFVGGEMTNVTGKCGGYNLHYAAASGYVIAKRIAGADYCGL